MSLTIGQLKERFLEDKEKELYKYYADVEKYNINDLEELEEVQRLVNRDIDNLDNEIILKPWNRADVRRLLQIFENLEDYSIINLDSLYSTFYTINNDFKNMDYPFSEVINEIDGIEELYGAHERDKERQEEHRQLLELQSSNIKYCYWDNGFYALEQFEIIEEMQRLSIN